MSPPAAPRAAAEPDDQPRCRWATGPWLTPYHDQEWGVPVHDDRRHFELIVLEGAQAGLSWLTVLRRRDGYRRAFADFDPEVVAGFGPDRIDALVGDPGIIRHRGKIEATVTNAAAFMEVQALYGSFDEYLWGFVDGRAVVNRWGPTDRIPATTPLAERISKDLRRRGLRFVGPTICYAYLQATGLVMDHLTSCFRYPALAGTEPSNEGRPGG
jgi:DNA-3-methyladenine glycosylase I